MPYAAATCLAVTLFGATLFGQSEPERRAVELVARMTLDEKIGQMQDNAPAIPRLNIPAYGWWNEALHGVARAGLATVFPQAIGLAATWDVDLQHRIADAISTEARGKYNEAIRNDNHGRYFGLTFWSPNINIFRDSRWGRGQETYGEDPYLTSRMGVAFVRGMQGDDPKYLKTVATAKHFAVHSGPESTRHEFDVKVSPEDLESTYLYAFRALIQEGHAQSVMCAYNAVDGKPACASDMLLQKYLRGEWGFQGYVVSDCGAVGDIYRGHHYAKTTPEAAADAVKTGTDLDCGSEYRTLGEAVKSGLIAEKDLDGALVRLFTARYRLGMFDSPEQVLFSKIGMDQVASPAHQSLALEAARKSIVLLKNENHFLPLTTPPKRIAVIGPAADDPDTLLGNYNGTPSHVVTPLAGIKQVFAQSQVTFAQGSVFAPSFSALVPAEALTITGQSSSAGIYYTGEFGKNSSAQWTGKLTAPGTGEYQLGFAHAECDSCQGTVTTRLLVNGKLLIEESRKAATGAGSRTAPIHLDAGKPVDIRLEYAQEGGGSGVEFVWAPPANVLLKQAVDLAKNADVIVTCVGLNSRLEGEESKIEIAGFDHGDRTSLDLPEPQSTLLNRLRETGKPIVLVLLNGSALALGEHASSARAIVEAWYGGQEGGTAIAETLSGADNPAGRLPVTFYSSASQLPPFDDYSMKGRTYRFFRGKPDFAFGYGLSYSEFQYSETGVRAQGDEFIVTAWVQNVSTRDGDEVAQLYTETASGLTLRGLERVHLRAGQRKQVSFTLARHDREGAKTIRIGGGQPMPDNASRR